jgi:hypothetical protein
MIAKTRFNHIAGWLTGCLRDAQKPGPLLLIVSLLMFGRGATARANSLLFPCYSLFRIG